MSDTLEEEGQSVRSRSLRVLLDTDHASILQRGEQPAALTLQHRLDQLRKDDVAISVVSFQEQVEGWLVYIRRAWKREELLRGFMGLHGLLQSYAHRTVQPCDAPAVDEYLSLRRQRIHIGTNDLRIAAIAKVNGMKLLSRNRRDFRQVPGLDVEDWTV